MVTRDSGSAALVTTYVGLDSFNTNTLEKELAEFRELGFDVDKLKKYNYNALQLSEIKKGIQEKVDINKFLNPKLSWLEMEEIRLELVQGIDMSSYREEGFSSQQIYQIRKGLSEGLDVSVYAKKTFLPEQMKQIRKGLEVSKDFPVIFYLDPAFDCLQMREIRRGLMSQVDVSSFAHVDMPYMKMRVIRESAEDGLFFDELKIHKYSSGVLDQMHKAFCEDIDLSPYIKRGYDAEQLEEIRISLKKELPIDKYISPEMRGDAIREIRLGLEHGIVVDQYVNPDFNWQQMYEMRLGLEHQIDITPYCKVLYWADQMKELRLGLEEGLDISSYSSMMYTAKDMRRRRQQLLLGDYGDEEDGTVNEEMSDGASKKLLIKLLDNKDKYVEITHDHMLCWFTYTPDLAKENLTEEVLVGFLKRCSVRYGMDIDMIRSIVAAPKPGEKYLVATGLDAVHGQDGYYEYPFPPVGNFEITETESGEADFSGLDALVRVNVGDVVARYHKSTVGTDGRNILGRTIHARKGKELPILSGEGFMILNDRVSYVAKYKGALSTVDGNLFVKKIMVVNEVRITDKIIRYDGTVVVTGDVNSGSEIHATGDVIISGHLESSTIVCGGSVSIKGGATCPVRGSIEAKGDVTGKFFEGVTITANNIFANSFVNCELDARGIVKTIGRDGSIYGGNCKTMYGVECAIAGSKGNAKTVLSVGVLDNALLDYHNMQKDLAREKEELRILNAEKDRLQELGAIRNRELMQWKIKINAAVGVKEKMIAEVCEKMAVIDENIKKGRKAKAVVNRMVYAGVIFVISGIVYRNPEDKKLNEPMNVKVDAKQEHIIIY